MGRVVTKWKARRVMKVEWQKMWIKCKRGFTHLRLLFLAQGRVECED